LLKDNFDEASFLYDLYKTSTVTEVSNFKWQLEATQQHLIEENMRGIMSQRDGFDHLCLDLVHAKQLLTDNLDPRVSDMRAQKERYVMISLIYSK